MTTFEYVTIKKAEEATGLTEKAIRHKIEGGEWLEGVQFIRRAGRIFVSVKGYNSWVEKGPDSRSTALASASG